MGRPRRAYDSVAWRQLRAEVLERDRHRCQIRGPYCEVEARAVDHIVPLAAGGAALDLGNCRAACRRCNSGRTANTAGKYPTPSREW